MFLLFKVALVDILWQDRDAPSGDDKDVSDWPKDQNKLSYQNNKKFSGQTYLEKGIKGSYFSHVFFYFKSNSM